MTKKSEPVIDLYSSVPIPGSPNTTSTRTEPETTVPSAIASDVNWGRIALRNA